MGLALSMTVHAADTLSSRIVSTQMGHRPGAQTATSATQTTQTQAEAIAQQQSQFWGLSIEEVRRALWLMQGPRGAFSAPNISPIEVLGIHAHSEAERRKYAEMFARALHDDTERVLAWAAAHADAMARLYPNEKVVDFATARFKPKLDPSVAEAALVPQIAIQPKPLGTTSGQRNRNGAGR